MHHVAIDDYVLDVLLPDLAGHDRAPHAFLVYLVLWTHLFRLEQKSVALSLRQLSDASGLSKSGVQAAIRHLKKRGLIEVVKRTATSVPEYRLIRHWLRRRAKSVSATA